MKYRVFAAACALLMLAGCATNIPVNAPFNPQEAQRLTQPGVNIVSGSALIRQRGGGVVTCAGLPVTLTPKTDYAVERMRSIFGNVTKGYSPVPLVGRVFIPDPPEYAIHSLTTHCDSQGDFQFANVADGQFFVSTGIVWMAGSSAQGGSLMELISVSGGEARRVVLSP